MSDSAVRRLNSFVMVGIVQVKISAAIVFPFCACLVVHDSAGLFIHAVIILADSLIRNRNAARSKGKAQVVEGVNAILGLLMKSVADILQLLLFI